MTRQRLARAANIGGTVLLGGVTAFVMIAALLYGGLQLAGYHFYEVQSPSMEPAIGTGDVVAMKPVAPHEVNAGDVIAYEREGLTVPVIHRVESVSSPPDVRSVFRDESGEIVGARTDYSERTFTTRGDANPVADVEPVPGDAVLGREAFVVSWPLSLVVTSFERGTLLAVGVGALFLYIAWGIVDAVRGRNDRRRQAAGAREEALDDEPIGSEAADYRAQR